MAPISARDLVPSSEAGLVRSRPWLLAAVLYNLVWGSGVILDPSAVFHLIGMPPA